MTIRTQERLRCAEEKKEEKERELEELEDKLAEEISQISDRWKVAADQIEEIKIPLEKADVDVEEMSVLWIPVG
jgi:esterase/lipase